jgi:hypothetical protein
MGVLITLGSNPTIQNSRSPTKSRRGTQKARSSALPFEVRVPNRRTRAAIQAGERGEVSRSGHRVGVLLVGLFVDEKTHGEEKRSP